MRKRNIILGLLLTSLVFPSCDTKTTKNTRSTESTNPVTTNPTTPTTPVTPVTPVDPTDPPYTGSCANGSPDASGIADSGQSIDYYKLNNPPVIAHGAVGGTIVWSSDTDLPSSYNQNIFYSDSRLNVRVIPKFQNKGVDSRGVTCAYYPQPFEKMNIGINIRRQSSSPGVGEYYQFQDVDVNCPSKVREFSVPATSDPLIVEVMNVEWDWSCKSYANQGYPNVPGACPYSYVWLTECYKLEIQFSTDTTKDLPGPRAN
jgi:hypothetical protein